MRRSNLLLRSMMFVPGHNERLLISASRSKADALILDIEDSVMPASNKQVARDKIKEKVTSGLFKNFSVFPRLYGSSQVSAHKNDVVHCCAPHPGAFCIFGHYIFFERLSITILGY